MAGDPVEQDFAGMWIHQRGIFLKRRAFAMTDAELSRQRKTKRKRKIDSYPMIRFYLRSIGCLRDRTSPIHWRRDWRTSEG